MNVSIFIVLLLNIFLMCKLTAQGPWIVGDARFDNYILAKDYKFNNIENFRDIIPIEEFAYSQTDPFQKFINDRYG